METVYILLLVSPFRKKEKQRKREIERERKREREEEDDDEEEDEEENEHMMIHFFGLAFIKSEHFASTKRSLL